MQVSNDSVLTRLVSRLEAATSRLEDIASSATSFDTPAPPTTATNGSFSVPTTAKPSAPSTQNLTPTPSRAPSAPPAIEDFDSLVNTDVKPFLNLSQELGGSIAEQVCCG